MGKVHEGLFSDQHTPLIELKLTRTIRLDGIGQSPKPPGANKTDTAKNLSNQQTTINTHILINFCSTEVGKRLCKISTKYECQTFNWGPKSNVILTINLVKNQFFSKNTTLHGEFLLHFFLQHVRGGGHSDAVTTLRFFFNDFEKN